MTNNTQASQQVPVATPQVAAIPSDTQIMDVIKAIDNMTGFNGIANNKEKEAISLIRGLLAQSATAFTEDAPRKLTLALPDYEKRRIVIVSDETIDDEHSSERLVCVAIQDAPAATPGQVEQRSDAERKAFNGGICVALQVITAMDCGVTWSEIVRCVGVDELLQYAALEEPDEWELAGFKKYARIELKRNKPREKA